jgi:hypothetical protein
MNPRATHKNNTRLIIRLPKEVKEQYQILCDEELIDMSVNIRQMIMQRIKTARKNK